MAYSEEEKEKIFTEVFSRMGEGESLVSICRSEEMPNPSTVHSWINDNDEKSNDYAHACEARETFIFEDILNIADSGENDTTTDQEGNVKINNEVIQRDRLRVDARKWVLSKMNPTRFSDRIQTEVSGPNGSPLVVNVIPDE